MSRTRRDYAQWLGEQLAGHPDAVDAACKLAVMYGKSSGGKSHSRQREVFERALGGRS